MQNTKRAVVVGGAGFIGSHLTDALIEKGYVVDVIDNLVAGKKEHVNACATLHVLDIRNYDDIAPVIKGADFVFHLAALPRVQFSIDHPKDAHDTNVNGMLNVLIASHEGGVGKFVYSASSSAYGDQTVMPLTEDMKPLPQSPYGLQKYIGEEYARVFAETYGLPTVSLRYFNVYGPRMSAEGAYALVLAAWFRMKKAGKPITITGDGEQTRDFTHVRDVIAANILAAESEKVGKGEVINIGAGREVTINELAQIVGGPTEHIPARQEPYRTLASNKKAEEVLGWKPRVRVEDGVAEIMKEWGLEK